jgi:hypothetical protein
MPMTLTERRLVMLPALVLTLAVGICTQAAAQEATSDEQESDLSSFGASGDGQPGLVGSSDADLPVVDSPDDLAQQKAFDENEAQWRALDDRAQAVLEHYRSLLEAIPGVTNVSTGMNSTETGVAIWVQTKHAPTQATLDSAPKELDGVEVRILYFSGVYLAQGVFDLSQKKPDK